MMIDPQQLSGKTQPLDEWGMTKREFFAAMAMQGMLSNDYLSDTYQLEACAVEHADRLIRALNESPIVEEES